MSVSVTRLIPLSQDCCQVISTFTALYVVQTVFPPLLRLYLSHCINSIFQLCRQLIQTLGSLYDCQWHCHAHSLLRNTNIVQKKNTSTQFISSLWKGTDSIFMFVPCFKSHVSWIWSLCQQWTCGWEFYGRSKDIRSFSCRANCL